MITHTIAPYMVPAPRVHVQGEQSKKFRGVPGSPDHKEFIFHRALKGCNFTIGQHVTYKRNPVQITDIYTVYSGCIEWDGLKPKFVEVYDGEELLLMHPSDLRRTR